MKNKLLIWAVLAGIAAAGFTVAGEGQKCSMETQACLNAMAQRLQAKGWVGIELDQDEETGRMTVTRVIPESPAEEFGLREGDVLLAMNGIELTEANKEKTYQAMKSMVPGKTVTYRIDRKGCCHIKGGQRDVEITLGKLPDSVLAEWVGRHMLEHAVIEVAQQ